jgi:hypothetical protein
VEENLPARHLGAENLNIPQGHDYEYDEAHDVPAGLPGGTTAPHRVNPTPKVNLGQGRGLDMTRPTNSAPHE